ncbi:uncharacterized protein LOC122390917 [Amphibalanus amphitrite]|uniref:uncharacterized protein LOC122390917 n=1 Tax=Amphibalanus amphitrite TaxID=1232801 RepID=UPI001C923FD9|nr:uncharacterized protein LOC122390917 [Amphibalanus amphitrite]
MVQEAAPARLGPNRRRDKVVGVTGDTLVDVPACDQATSNTFGAARDAADAVNWSCWSDCWTVPWRPLSQRGDTSSSRGKSRWPPSVVDENKVWKELSRIKNADLQDTNELELSREAMTPIVANGEGERAAGCLTDDDAIDHLLCTVLKSTKLCSHRRRSHGLMWRTTSTP